MTDLAVSPAAPTAAPAAALMSAPPTSTPAPPLTISPDFLRLLGKSEQEVRIELAIFFYKEYQISPGKAGAIAGLSRIEFWEELGKRKIPINYDVEDFMLDMENLRQFNEKFPVKTRQK